MRTLRAAPDWTGRCARVGVEGWGRQSPTAPAAGVGRQESGPAGDVRGRPSVRLGATGRPQGTRRTFRTRPAGVGWGRRGAAGEKAGRTSGGERGLPQVEQPGARTAFPGRNGEGSCSASRMPGCGEKGSLERWAEAGAFRGQWWRLPDLGDPRESGGRAGWLRASEWTWPSAGLPGAEV